MKVAAFDIGIRNLAWCLADLSGTTVTQILGWDNYDLLAHSSRGSSAAVAKPKCHACASKPIFSCPTAESCGRHCPTAYPPLKDLSGNPLKAIPVLKVLKEIAIARGVDRRLNRVKMLEALAKVVSLPIIIKKKKNATKTDMVELHDAIRAFVIKHAATLRLADRILLENQPVLKNPTMKTVQVMLFATLRDVLQPAPPVLELVHAGKKVKGATTGDAGYKDRKLGTEQRVAKFFEGGSLPSWHATYTSHGKKSDLADAFCMCLDSVT
jgi:hypothetical protein